MIYTQKIYISILKKYSMIQLKHKNAKKKKQTNGPTDLPTDRHRCL